MPIPMPPKIEVAEESDQAVVREVLGGDVARFEVLMRRYNQRLFRAARSILRDDAEAEDTVQHAYLSAYAALGGFRQESSVGTWLTKIAVHEALRRRRAQERSAGLRLVPPIDSKSQLPHSTPEDDMQRQELRGLIEKAVDELPEPQRVVFVLRDVEELTTREVATTLAISEEAVRVRLHRARRALRDWLEGALDMSSGEVFSFAGDRCDRIVAGVLGKLESR